jgi:hypothetical protein
MSGASQEAECCDVRHSVSIEGLLAEEQVVGYVYLAMVVGWIIAKCDGTGGK